MHCKVCQEDIPEGMYFEHVGSQQHYNNYHSEVDIEDGFPILNKLDNMFKALEHEQIYKSVNKVNYDTEIKFLEARIKVF